MADDTVHHRIATVPVSVVPRMNSLWKHFRRLQFGTRNNFFRASGPSDKSWGHLVYLPFFQKVGKYTKICAVIRVKLWTRALCHFERWLNKYFIAVKGRPIREQVKSYHIYGETRKMDRLFLPRRITTVPVAMVPRLNSLLKHFTRLQFGTRNTFFRASGPTDKSWGHLVYLPFFRKIGKYTKICAVIRVKLWTGGLCHF